MMNPIQIYLSKIQANLDTGQATEHTHRATLGELIETLAPNFNAINEPTRIACGSPDFVVLNKVENIPIGYIEAKDIGVSLDKALKTEQLQRYLPLGNVILTDYLTFRWFVEEQERDEMRVTLATIDENAKLIANESANNYLTTVTNKFKLNFYQVLADKVHKTFTKPLGFRWFGVYHTRLTRAKVSGIKNML